MPTVLIADDRAINREFLATLLGYAGFGVIEAADGAEALELVRDRRPDLVITDIIMPVMDGMELVRRLRADPAFEAVPVIFYTATYRLNEAREMAEACGAAAVISKPAEPEVILATVATALRVTPHPLARGLMASSPGALGMLPPHHREVVELEQRLQRALEEGRELIGVRGEAPGRQPDPLLRAYSTVQALSLRLAALLELGLMLPAERDPQQLLELVCRAACDILDARLAVAATGVEGPRPRRFAAHGATAEQIAALAGSLDVRAGVLGEALAEGAARRLGGLDGDPAAVGLPAVHPPVHALLAVPLVSGSRTQGLLYLVDKVGGGVFSDDDEQFAVTLAAQLGPAHESLVLHDEVRHHARRLEAEIAERRRAAAELAESELRFRQLAEAIHEVFFLRDPARAEMLYVSPAYEEVWGRSRESLYQRPDSWFEAIHPDDRERAAAIVASTEASGEFDFEYRIVRPDGDVRWIRAQGFPVRDAEGRAYRVAGVAEDVTQRKQHEARIARLTRIYALLSGINSAIVRIREPRELFEEACRVAVTGGAFAMAWIGTVDADTGEGTIVARAGGLQADVDTLRFTTRPDTPDSERPASRAAREGRAIVINDLAADPLPSWPKDDLLARGHRSIAAFPLTVDDRVAAVLTLIGREAGLFDKEELALLSELAGDISFGMRYLEKERQVDYLAYYDALTGLANARLFGDRLGQLLQGARHDGDIVAVILVDLDRFTRLNDTLGRHVGDALLRAVGERLSTALEEPCVLARVGGDDFAVAVGDLAQVTDAAALVEERIFAALGRPFPVDGSEVRLSASAGIALYPGDGDDAATLYKHAEVALKRALASGARVLHYAPEISARAAERLEFENRLRRAIEERRFVLHYQPKLDTRGGRPAGVEALLRWADPDGGLVPPGRFIPVLEETGMIVEVGRWLLSAALAQHRAWREAGLEAPRVAVNVSPFELRRGNFAASVARALAEAEVGPEALELEITESVIMEDIEATTAMLREIADLGVPIAVDDFGTGHSSLRYLAKLPVASLKIDRSFIVTMGADPDAMAIVSTVISLAHALDLEVVAEGVDAGDQAKLLRLMRCDRMQGFLFSRPVPAAECEAFLQPGFRFELP